ncbi:hypothetical protein BDP27DRAFT_1370152 [Rhodocollybia butyracea]|uniref:Uncharacterized protein n=1 Tax=Rhodocollybia butyracea TaxID=206335 RepID=A0A9P5U0S7_9AGAR|nr:hypothetical protein BDP27DRAFT_1370152 [Rhodocollybia butyracea]
MTPAVQLLSIVLDADFLALFCVCSCLQVFVLSAIVGSLWSLILLSSPDAVRYNLQRLPTLCMYLSSRSEALDTGWDFTSGRPIIKHGDWKALSGTVQHWLLV